MSTVDKIDEGLSMYYKQMNRDYFDTTGTGKFKAYCEENGLDPDDIPDEIEVKDATESMLIEFDQDDDGNNLFPTTEILNDNEKATKILEIIRACYEVGYYKPVEVINPNKELDFDLLLDEFERCVFLEKCQVVPNPFYSPSMNESAAPPKNKKYCPVEHIEKAKKIISVIESQVRYAVKYGEDIIHPFYIYFLHHRAFYSSKVNGVVPVDVFDGT
eukprot:446647_1